MGTYFLAGDFNVPASNEPGQHLGGTHRGVRTEKNRGVALLSARAWLFLFVTHQHPAQAYGVMARGRPERDLTDPFDVSHLVTIPGHLRVLPRRVRGGQPLPEGELAGALLGLRATLTRR